MGTRAAALANLQKALKSPQLGKHGPWSKTLLENKARERYLEKLAEHFEEIADVQIAAAKDVVNGEKDRKEVIHQFVGKPAERIEVRSVSIKIDV